MTDTIFYSWQSDLPNRTNRSFIQTALETAAARIRSDATLAVEPVVDRDTLGEPGAPDIAATILRKIAAASAFVCDVSFVTAFGGAARPSPNPNVLLELGYALRALGAERILMIFNAATGDVSNLPFDPKFKRVLQYKADKSDDIPQLRHELTARVEEALRAIFAHKDAAKHSRVTGEFVSQLLSALIPVLIFSDQARERRIGDWADDMRNVFRGSTLSIRRLATNASAENLGVSERLETLAVALDRVLNHTGHLGDGDEYRAKLSDAVRQATELKTELTDGHDLAPEEQEKVRSHLANQARTLKGLTNRASRALHENDPSSASDLFQEASQVGYVLLQLCQYRLDFLSPTLVEALRPEARALHLLEVQASREISWDRQRKRLEQLLSLAQAIRNLIEPL
jgi:hypothetical protein